jgi:hypothetical protein
MDPSATLSPSIGDRFELWMSTGRIIDGLWVGGVTAKAIPKVEDAVGLISQHDPRRYNRMRRDLSRVWVRILPGHRACFNAAARACELDERFVASQSVSTAEISVAIVHEATHARIHNCGIQYVQDRRLAIEIACRRQELAFVARLPSTGELQEDLRRWLASPPSPDVWTDSEMERRLLDGAVAAFQHLGVPKRLIPILMWLRKPITTLRRFLRNARAA